MVTSPLRWLAMEKELQAQQPSAAGLPGLSQGAGSLQELRRAQIARANAAGIGLAGATTPRRRLLSGEGRH